MIQGIAPREVREGPDAILATLERQDLTHGPGPLETGE
jgi:hypothetical protein